MASNPWVFKAIEYNNYYNGPFQVKLAMCKRDIRGGFDLGRIKKESFIIIEDIAFTRKSKEYWKRIFMKIWDVRERFDVDVPQEKIKEAIQNIRQVRYYHRRPKFKTWAERYGKRIADWAIHIIEKEIDDPCKDNYRLARVGDKKALKYYIKQQDNGCCGQFDIIVRCPFDWFRKYHMGCNYGH